MAGHESACRTLLESKADVNAQMLVTGWSPLMFAVRFDLQPGQPGLVWHRGVDAGACVGVLHAKAVLVDGSAFLASLLKMGPIGPGLRSAPPSWCRSIVCGLPAPACADRDTPFPAPPLHRRTAGI